MNQVLINPFFTKNSNNSNEKNNYPSPHHIHVTLYFHPLISQTQLGEDIPGVLVDDKAGAAVSISSDGNRVAIGAPGNGANAGGFAMVFEWDGANWTQLGSNVDGTAENDFFGEGISLSDDGTRMLVGGPNNDGGYAQVHEFSTVSPTIFRTEKWDVNIYPNPTTGIIELSGVQNAAITIVDSFGKILRQEEVASEAMDISDLPNGIYFVRVSSGEQFITERIVKG